MNQIIFYIILSNILILVNSFNDDIFEPESRFRRSTKSGSECTTPVCKSASAQMLVKMDHHADACEEFQEMVCGNEVRINGFTLENFKVLEGYVNAKITFQSEKFLQDFKKFYKSCVGYDVDFNFLRNVDFVVAKSLSSTDLTDVFAESILTQSMPFFDIGLDIGAPNETYQFLLTLPGESVLKIHTKGWSIVENIQKYCLDYIGNSVNKITYNLDAMHVEYQKCISEILQRKIDDFNSVLTTTNKTDSQAYLKEILSLYKGYNLPEEMIRDVKNSRSFVEMSIDEIQSKYGVIDWIRFFGRIASNKTFAGDDKVLVAFPDHFKSMFEAFRKIETGKLTKMVQQLISFHLYENLVSQKRTSKKFYCMDLTQQLMPDVVSWILYELSPAKKIFFAVYQSNKLFSDIKDMLKQSFQDSSLDDMTKDKFIKKLDSINLGLITSGDTNATKDNYKYVKIRDDYQENVVNLMKNYRKFLYNVVNSKSSPATLLNYFVNGFYSKPVTFYTSDSIVLHPEVYKKLPTGLPEYVRLAKLGFSLAQGITKHFDSNGRLYMTDGIRSNDDYYEELISHMTEVFKEFYSKSPYTFHKSILEFNPIVGKEFVNEMITDNAAFRLVTELFGKIKNAKQMPWIGNVSLPQVFFIAAAQEFCDDQSETSFMIDLIEKRHLPYQIKIRNIVSNSESFSKSFQCVKGSSLWLEPSIIRQFPQDSLDYEDEAQGQGQYEN